MNNSLLSAVVFNPTIASEDLFKAYFDIIDTWLLEMNPHETLEPREARKSEVIKPNPRRNFFRWLFFPEESESNKAVGYGVLKLETEFSPNYEENKNIGLFDIYVLKEFRGLAIEKDILRTIIRKANKMELNTLQTSTNIDYEHDLFEQLNGKIVLENTLIKLFLADLDWELMKEWREQGMLLQSEGVSIESFEVVPEEIVDEYVQIYTETINQQPYGDYEGRPKITKESRRREEEYMKDLGIHWYTLISREADGRISGLTEIEYNPKIPFKVEQLLTGVKEEYRERGLGKWLKAEMAFYVKEKFSNVEYFSTGNIDTNTPMISINKRMGFKPIISFKHYKFELRELKNTLDSFSKNKTSNIG